MEYVKIYDKNGVERTWSWVESNYGQVEVYHAPPKVEAGYVFRLKTVRETEGPAVVIATIDSDPSGDGSLVPVQENVGFYWPDPEEPISTASYQSRWMEYVGARQKTGPDGETGFGLGGGSYYLPPDLGPHWMWVLSEEFCSDALANFGMLANTNHRGILRAEFLLQWEEKPDPPIPPDPDPEIEREFQILVDDHFAAVIRGRQMTITSEPVGASPPIVPVILPGQDVDQMEEDDDGKV